MTISDAYVTVTCDNCGGFEEIMLTATARRGWDDRSVEIEIENMNWVIVGDHQYCSSCAEDLGLKE